ncbi:MAG: hypothetical protein KKG91_06255 [Candidatus Omnitrophica bacterium]|nr:hypothetical protein [Candidatus Omnitrophota bacterium]
MRYRILFLVLVFFLPSFFLAAENPGDGENKVITEEGVIIEGMPEENLEHAGFTKDFLISENVSGDQQYLTFLDISTVEAGDNITFYLQDNKIIDWFRGTDVGTLEETIIQ